MPGPNCHFARTTRAVDPADEFPAPLWLVIFKVPVLSRSQGLPVFRAPSCSWPRVLPPHYQLPPSNVVIPAHLLPDGRLVCFFYWKLINQTLIRFLASSHPGKADPILTSKFRLDFLHWGLTSHAVPSMLRPHGGATLTRRAILMPGQAADLGHHLHQCLHVLQDCALQLQEREADIIVPEVVSGAWGL